MSPDLTIDIAGHAAQARDFLARAREYLAAGDLHQASEKGWGAAAHMVKAVALAQGWKYEAPVIAHGALVLLDPDRARITCQDGSGQLMAVQHASRNCITQQGAQSV